MALLRTFFLKIFRTNDSYIAAVTEVHVAGIKSCLLAVGLQLSPDGGKVCLISVQGSCVIGAVDLVEKVTACTFIPETYRSVLRVFDGCLAIGTDQGKIILLDMCLKKCKRVLTGTMSSEDNLKVAECHIVYGNIEPDEIIVHHQQSKTEGIYFGIQLEPIEEALIMSVLAIPHSLTLVVGLDDGRMILYDLEVLQAFHLAFPPEKLSPLTYLAYIEPADDPRACIYVWALHTAASGTIGVMHSIMFERKFIDKVESIYKNFISCSVRLTMPFDERSVPICCQAVTKVIDEQEEQKLTLCIIGWATPNKGSFLMVFDLNQWYKEQMPEIDNWTSFPSYTATFPLGDILPLDIFVDPTQVTPFVSVQRPEEHFHPNSLSFDTWILGQNTILNTYWPGLQNKVLQSFIHAGSAAILKPNNFVKEMQEAALTPQFQDFYASILMGLENKREFLLTVALEYNCVKFLKQLALTIADGSHIGSIPNEALGLSTMTDWLWQRATTLKDISNSHCVALFDYSGRTIDRSIQRTLMHCTRQMKLLAELMEMICSDCKQFIPETVMETLNSQLESIKLASDYQEMTQWLLNVGLVS